VVVGFSMISAPVTMGSRDWGRTDITARVCLLRATRAPTTRSSGGTYSDVVTMKSGPVLLLTMTRPSTSMSLMLPMIRGGDLRRSSSERMRLISFWSRKSSLSTYLFSPSTLLTSSRSSLFWRSSSSSFSTISLEMDWSSSSSNKCGTFEH